MFEAEQPGAERAELRYQLLESSKHYHLLHIQLVTGRHHQIRAQLAAIGCPIKGDVKYGARRSNPDRSIHLHAWRLAFDNPATGERILLEAAPPEEVLWQALGPGRADWSLFKKSFLQSPTNCDGHLAESIFQTHSKLKSEVLLLQNTLLYYVKTIFCFFVRKILLFRISAFLNIQFCISCMLVNKCLSWRHIASHQYFRHAGSHTGILNFHPFHSPGFRI